MSNLNHIDSKKLLERIEYIGGQVPNSGKYHIVGLQNPENKKSVFNDSFYIFDGPGFVHSSEGTTSLGKTSLIHFKEYKLKGNSVWKTNQSIQDCFKPILQKGKKKLLKANSKIIYYRNNKTEEPGEMFHGNILAHMYGVDYNPYSQEIKQNINDWSFGSPVWSNMSEYRLMINAVLVRNKTVQYTLLKEW
jgi:hypothetical protein